MRLSSKSTQEAFVRSPWLKIGSLVGMSVLLIASIFGVSKAFSLPSTIEQSITVMSCEHSGTFDYLVYLKPNSLYGDVVPTEEEAVSMVFFRNIIREVQLAFSYKFDSSQSLADVTNEVVVSIIAANPGLWQKEIPQLEETRVGTEFAVNFPLNLNYLDGIVDDIEEDIGIASSTRNFIIRAVVHTTAETTLGKTIEDEFSYELTAVLTAKELELQGNLGSSKAGSTEGINYEGRGRFDYEVHLKPNNLYETDVLKSEAIPVAEPPASLQALGPGLVYFPKIINNIEASFSYQFKHDMPVENLIEDVEVTASIEYPDMWSKTLTLVPKTSKSGAFMVDFPIDIGKFNEVTDTLRDELGFGASSYDLIIKAVVHTTADTDSGRIDEVFTQSLQGKLGGSTLSFTGSLAKRQPSTIQESRTVPAPKAHLFRALSLVILALVVFAFVFVIWNARLAKALPISKIEAEAVRARRKYKNVIIDVGELPPTEPGEVIIPISSVDELVRTSDALLKPVLHQAGADKHIYCVIDGAIRYQYIIET
jgi:hypothetical protein